MKPVLSGMFGPHGVSRISMLGGVLLLASSALEIGDAFGAVGDSSAAGVLESLDGDFVNVTFDSADIGDVDDERSSCSK